MNEVFPEGEMGFRGIHKGGGRDIVRGEYLVEWLLPFFQRGLVNYPPPFLRLWIYTRLNLFWFHYKTVNVCEEGCAERSRILDTEMYLQYLETPQLRIFKDFSLLPVFYIFGICASRRRIWLPLGVCGTLRSKARKPLKIGKKMKKTNIFWLYTNS